MYAKERVMEDEKKAKAGAANASKTEQSDSDAAARGVVARMARGNVLLQGGKYLTQADMDAKREAVLNHKF